VISTKANAGGWKHTIAVEERRKRAIADNQDVVKPDHTQHAGCQGEEGYPVLKLSRM